VKNNLNKRADDLAEKEKACTLREVELEERDCYYNKELKTMEVESIQLSEKEQIVSERENACTQRGETNAQICDKLA
jgi:hypothetical protein